MNDEHRELLRQIEQLNLYTVMKTWPKWAADNQLDVSLQAFSTLFDQASTGHAGALAVLRVYANMAIPEDIRWRFTRGVDDKGRGPA